MGTEFVPKDANNQYGTYEDREMFNAVRDVMEGRRPESDLAELVAKRSGQLIWGIKDPALAQAAHYLWPYTGETFVVLVKRDRQSVINSYMRAYGRGRVFANKWYDGTLRDLAARMMEFDGPILDVDFSDLMEDSAGQVARIVDFAFAGMDKPPELFVKDAIGSVRQEKPLNKGWGEVAVGVRVARHPDPFFFADWTALLTTGLRGGDTVLMPAMHMPAHWASRKIVEQFLESKKDSLLFVDDDMTFNWDALHRMRDNEDTWKFDVVSGLAVRRSVESPTAVVMLKQDELPLPHRLRGDSFEKYPLVKEGNVIDVDAVGLAFTLVRRSVFEKLLDDTWDVEYSVIDLFNYGPGYESDDLPFSRACREAGLRLGVDTNIMLGHVANHSLSYEDYKKWLANKELADV
jgi:hypothetical protein